MNVTAIKNKKRKGKIWKKKLKKKNLMIFSLCNNLQAGIRRKRPWKGERSQRKAAKQQVDRSQWKGKAERTKAAKERGNECKRERGMEQTERRHGNWKWKQTGNCSQKAAEAAGCEIKRKSYSTQSERDFRIRMQCQFEIRRTKWAQVRSENFDRERERMCKCRNVNYKYNILVFCFHSFSGSGSVLLLRMSISVSMLRFASTEQNYEIANNGGWSILLPYTL